VYSHEIGTSVFFSVSVTHTQAVGLLNLQAGCGQFDSRQLSEFFYFAVKAVSLILEKQDAYRLSLSVALSIGPYWKSHFETGV
jgi:hypothetical protein